MQPKLLSLAQMRSLLEAHSEEVSRHIYFDRHLAIVHSTLDILRLFIQQQPPFTFNDRRMGIVVKGEARTNLNLVEKHFTAGMLIYFGPGSIISPVSISPDFEIYGIGLPTDFPLPGPLPQALNGQVRDFQLPVNEADRTTAMNILDTIWHIVHQPDYNIETVSSLVAAQMHHYDALYRQFSAQQQNTQSREQTIFDRFIQLVNLHAEREHQIAFYADKMCLTERYLGTVVRQASGVTAKDWIDRAILTRIKVELRHSDKTLANIAEEMDFPNPSFFNKYFKRLTGMTPAEFRNCP
ncbi:MAG: helix-turn-helix domain-containing protein [Bacteroidales bacterium]|nr:helix-turn-helix domain-containing protein [Bacteroidales bacterium]